MLPIFCGTYGPKKTRRPSWLRPSREKATPTRRSSSWEHPCHSPSDSNEVLTFYTSSNRSSTIFMPSLCHHLPSSTNIYHLFTIIYLQTIIYHHLPSLYHLCTIFISHRNSSKPFHLLHPIPSIPSNPSVSRACPEGVLPRIHGERLVLVRMHQRGHGRLGESSGIRDIKTTGRKWL